MTRYDGAIDCYTAIMAEEGVAGLYKGFGGLVLQYALHVAVLKLTRLGFDLMSSRDVAPTVEDVPPTSYESMRPASGVPRMRAEYSGPRGDYTGPGRPV
jgi:solute carrier family 25, member 46